MESLASPASSPQDGRGGGGEKEKKKAKRKKEKRTADEAAAPPSEHQLPGSPGPPTRALRANRTKSPKRSLQSSPRRSDITAPPSSFPHQFFTAKRSGGPAPVQVQVERDAGGRLGVEVVCSATSSDERSGVYILKIHPGGPASKCASQWTCTSLAAGMRLLSINGVNVQHSLKREVKALLAVQNAGSGPVTILAVQDPVGFAKYGSGNISNSGDGSSSGSKQQASAQQQRDSSGDASARSGSQVPLSPEDQAAEREAEAALRQQAWMLAHDGGGDAPAGDATGDATDENPYGTTRAFAFTRNDTAPESVNTPLTMNRHAVLASSYQRVARVRPHEGCMVAATATAAAAATATATASAAARDEANLDAAAKAMLQAEQDLLNLISNRTTRTTRTATATEMELVDQDHTAEASPPYYLCRADSSKEEENDDDDGGDNDDGGGNGGYHNLDYHALSDDELPESPLPPSPPPQPLRDHVLDGDAVATNAGTAATAGVNATTKTSIVQQWCTTVPTHLAEQGFGFNTGARRRLSWNGGDAEADTSRRESTESGHYGFVDSDDHISAAAAREPPCPDRALALLLESAGVFGIAWSVLISSLQSQITSLVSLETTETPTLTQTHNLMWMDVPAATAPGDLLVRAFYADVQGMVVDDVTRVSGQSCMQRRSTTLQRCVAWTCCTWSRLGCRTPK